MMELKDYGIKHEKEGDGAKIELTKDGHLACRAKVYKNGGFTIEEGKDPDCRRLIQEIINKSQG